MSSGGGEGPRYWCHACNTMVVPLHGAEEEVTCSLCRGGFVEEMESPPPGAGFETGGGGEGAAQDTMTGGAEELMNRMMEGITAAVYGQETGGGGAVPFNPMTVMQSLMGAAPAGGNIQIIFDHTGGGGGGAAGGGGGIRLPGTIGDYYLGAGLEQLIQQLAENDPNRYGTLPASKAAVEAMPTVKITKEHLNSSDAAQCAVCKDTFEEGTDARQIPCKHIYHSECILPWLELHSTCPVCRYEMPTEGPQNPGSSAPAGDSNARPDNDIDTGGAAGGAAGRGGARRIRIQFPFPFPGAGPQQAGGSSSSGQRNPNNDNSQSGNNNNNDGEPPISEAREEDLD